MGSLGGREAELVREGEYWTIRVDGRELRVRDSKGMRHLAELLGHPHREIEVLALVGAHAADPVTSAAAARDGLRTETAAAGAPLLDEQARRDYRARLDDLSAEIEEADRFHDPERAARAREERAAIADEISAATGLGGRDRRTGTADERARLNVTRAIRSAIARISEHDRALGEHLAAAVHTGRVCVYRPHSPDLEWSISARRAPRARPRRILAPDVQYARKGDVSIAYQVVGDGPIDVVLVNGLVAHLDLLWAEPTSASLLRAIAGYARLILFDKPGTGLSDPVAGAPSLEQRIDDITAVMDAVGSRRAALIGYSEGGMPAAAFAALYPQRTAALVLLNTTARSAPGSDFASAFDHFWWLVELAAERWGEGKFFQACTPSWGDGLLERRVAAGAERACASPGMVRALVEALREYDVRPVLPYIGAPTLVLHARDEPLLAVEFGRDLAAQIPGARFIEFPGVDHLCAAGDWQPVISATREFLTGDLGTPTGTPLRFTLHVRGHSAEATIAEFGGRPIADDEGAFAFERASTAVLCAQTLLDASTIESAGVDLTREGAAALAADAEPGTALVSAPVRALLAGAGIRFDTSGAAVSTDDADRGARPVGSVDAATAAITPGPRSAMTALDRAAVATAARAPGLSRMGFRLRRATRRKPS